MAVLEPRYNKDEFAQMLLQTPEFSSGSPRSALP